MDDFRRIQKSHCSDYSKHKHKYGCPCCRMFGNISLNKFKKLSRKVAKGKLRTRVNKYIKGELND
jgi:hypothetical protein